MSTKQRVEIDAERLAYLERVQQAAWTYVHTPIDDPDAGVLYRELQQAVRRSNHDE
jgi:hypothetical protein